MGQDLRALIVATMDTKGREAVFLKEILEDQGLQVLILDAGIRGQSPIPVDITNLDVARAAGSSLEQVRSLKQEGQALEAMISGAVKIVGQLIKEGKIDGIIGLGGSMGTTLGTAVMRALPIGFPKVMITTMASRNTRPFVGTKDILMLHSVCDLSGLNRITREVLHNGALALSGMVRGRRNDHDKVIEGEKPLVAVSTLGTTEACVVLLRERLEETGREVITFHTVGSGGQAMDEIIEGEDVELSLEISLHELMDHLFGGDYDAGPNRATAALKKGVPTVMVPGNTDFLVTGPLEEAKKKFPGRIYHVHNSAITVVRTTSNEMVTLAQALARSCMEAKGPVAFLIPLGGFSAFDSPGSPLEDKGARYAFRDALKDGLPPGISVFESRHHINDPQFVDELLQVAKDIL